MSRYNIYNICFTRIAKNQFESLPAKVKAETTKILEEELACSPLSGKPLQGALKGLRFQRSGALRIVYQIIKNELVIIIVDLEHRKKVYQRLKLKTK